MKKKILFVFGTRPEAIKMAPLIHAFQQKKEFFEVKVCVTGQHKEMLYQVLDFFEITPDVDLELMQPNQNLYQLTSSVLLHMQSVLESEKPDYVMVHGDTTTSMATSLATFYAGAKIVHIEAGLRTYDKHSPFPEEMNRQITGRLADFHFAPTESAKENLLKEGIAENQITITGNTVIDALFWAREKINSQAYQNQEIEALKKKILPSKKVILVTGHRRENHGEGIAEICQALKKIALDFQEEVQIIYPVHLNPKVQNPVNHHLQGIENIALIKPLSYPSFVWLMEQSYLILTDSGGIQEEAPSLGKPVLLMRDTTERPEAVQAGTVKMVHSDKNKIYTEVQKLITQKEYYKTFTKKSNPYGNGEACDKIVKTLEQRESIHKSS